jgi:hypothetical protein
MTWTATHHLTERPATGYHRVYRVQVRTEPATCALVALTWRDGLAGIAGWTYNEQVGRWIPRQPFSQPTEVVLKPLTAAMGS